MIEFYYIIVLASLSARTSVALVADSRSLRYLAHPDAIFPLLVDIRKGESKELISVPSPLYPSLTSKEWKTTDEEQDIFGNEYWMDEFLADRIGNILVEKGAEYSAAMEAGKAVQSKAQNRLVRQIMKLGGREFILNGVNRDVIVKLGLVNSYDVEAVIQVLIDAGLSGIDCAAILTHTPSVALTKAKHEVDGPKSNMSVEEIIDRLLNVILCGTLKLRKYDARKILRGCPGLVTSKGYKGAAEVVSLFSALGVSYNSLARDKKALPNLLSRPPTALFRLVAFLSSDSIRMPVKNIGPLLRRTESLPLIDAVCPVKNDRLSVKNVEDHYRDMKTVADLLRTYVVLDLCKVIAAHPSVLLFDPFTQILPVAHFIHHEIGMDEGDVCRVITSHPSLLGVEVSNIQEVIDFLHEHDVSNDAIIKIFRAFPSIFLLDIHSKMVPVINFLQEVGVVNIGRFITRLPPVLGYSVEKELIPKWKFLIEECKIDKFSVLQFPAFFSYPLDKVIITRFEYLRFKGIPFNAFSLDTILRFGDVDFAKSVVGDDDSGEFLQFASQRSKKRRRVRTAKNSLKSKPSLMP